MKQLLTQSDDYGISDGVSAGILKSIKEGFIRNTGLFVNMPSSEKAAKKIRDIDVCLGIDINFVAGQPVSPISEVPDFLDDRGMFKSSRMIISENKLKSTEGFIAVFEQDPYPYQQVLTETYNQVEKFIKLMGKKPEYLHSHSLCTPNTVKAMRTVANDYQIPFSLDILNDDSYHYLLDKNLLNKNKTIEEQTSLHKKESFLNTTLPSITDQKIAIYILHCGFVDYDLFKASSLTYERMMDLDIATDATIKEYIKQEEIELITYRDLLNNE